MPPPRPRSASVPALAKINLALQVLNRRHDGFHELRTIFQTISLADRIRIDYRPGRGVSVAVVCDPPIENNIAARAAHALAGESGWRGEVTLHIEKRIPMGGGLGGGSSDAAAVLLALPALTGKSVPIARLIELAAKLGSDVPFFLLGGTAVGLGRGEELYPLPEPAPVRGLLVCPSIQVSTAEAFRALDRTLTVAADSRNINSFQYLSWELGERVPLQILNGWGRNDFEPVVGRQHPELLKLAGKLKRSGAGFVRMTGSGSAWYGLFPERKDAERAAELFPGTRTEIFDTIRRARYRALWRRSLREHLREVSTWPPLSRYAK